MTAFSVYHLFRRGQIFSFYHTLVCLTHIHKVPSTGGKIPYLVVGVVHYSQVESSTFQECVFLSKRFHNSVVVAAAEWPSEIYKE
jgi:hypothetical protein